MILSPLVILRLNEQLIREGKNPLIEGLSKRELDNPEGVGLDLRVGRVEKIIGPSFLGADMENEKNRYSPKTELIGDINQDGKKLITINPGDYLLVQTMEKINSPSQKLNYNQGFPEGYLIPLVFPRSSLQRGGVSFHATKTDPGYFGELTFGIKNLGNYEFLFELGARMFNVLFEVVIGDIKRSYSGQHQGGRVTSEGKLEKQN